MYKDSVNRYSDDIKINAQLHGAKFKDKSQTRASLEKEIPKDTMMFAHPNAYKDMTDKEKKELTAKMMQKHKSWASGLNFGNNRVGKQ